MPAGGQPVSHRGDQLGADENGMRGGEATGRIACMHSVEVEVRAYSDVDWAAISSIHDAARLDELRNSVGVEAFLTLAQTAEGEGLFDGQVWVAVVGGVVAGFVALDDDEVTWLYVDPQRYRQGVGRALLRHALAAAGPG